MAVKSSKTTCRGRLGGSGGRGTGNGRGTSRGFKPSCLGGTLDSETVCWGDEYAHPEFPDKTL